MTHLRRDPPPGTGPSTDGAPPEPLPGESRAASGWAALVVVYIVWGSTYLAIRVADESMPPLVMAGARYLVAGAVLLPFVARDGGGSFAWPSRQQLAGCAAVGALMLAGGNGGVSWAERSMASGLAALLVASVPLWLVLLDRVVNRSAPSAVVITALLVGFAGVAVLARPSGSHAATSSIIVVLVASISWAVGSFLGRKVPQPRRPLTATAFQMLAGGVVLAAAAGVTGEIGNFDPSRVSVRSWLAVAYLIGPGSILALTCYTVALRKLPLSMVSTYAYVNPVIAVALGWAVLNENVTATTFVGGGLVVAAVALVVSRGRRPAGSLSRS